MSDYQRQITDTSLLPSSCSFLDFTPDSDEESDVMISPSISSRQSKPKPLNLQKQYIYHTSIRPPPIPLLSPTWKSEKRLSSDNRSIASASSSTSLEYHTFKSPYTPLHEQLTRSTSSSLPAKRHSQGPRITSPPKERSSRLLSSASSISASSSCFTIPEATTFTSPYSSLLLPSARRQSTGGFTGLSGPKLRRSISSGITTQNTQPKPIISSKSPKSERNLREEIPTIAFANASPAPIQVSVFESQTQLTTNPSNPTQDHQKHESIYEKEIDLNLEFESSSSLSRSQSFKSCTSEESSFLSATAQDEVPITPLSPKFNSNSTQSQHQIPNSSQKNVSLRKKKSLRNDRFKYDLVINWIESSSSF